MTRTLLAALLLTLAPAVAAAQSLGASLDAPAVPAGYGAAPSAPVTEGTGIDPEILELRGAAAPYGESVASERRASGPSFGASFGHASAGLGMGSAAGALIGGGISALACQDSGDFLVCPAVGLISAGLGALATAPLGAAMSAWGFGEVSGGTGNFFAALGGAYTGAMLGFGVGALVGHAGDVGWAFLVGPVVGAVASALGAAVGYQLSSTGPRREGEARASASPVALPLVAPTEDGRGVTVGAAGMF